MNDWKALSEAVIRGDRDEATRLTRNLIAAGHPPLRIADEGLVPGMAVVGERFKRNEIYVPEMLIAARAMKESMALLEPLMVKAGVRPRTTAVIGTVQGDLHDIGKHLVAMMWKGANFGVVDLGTNVSPEQFIKSVKEHGARLVGLSTLLSTTMAAMERTVQALRAAGLPRFTIMVGGAPVTHEFARKIGADGYAPDAATAVDVAQELLRAAG
ncbi:MAG: corrinoid protein [Planctomycetota bacterium]